MTKTEMAISAAMYHLKSGSMTCSTLGALLWGKKHRNPQSYARPAGKLLHLMKRKGIVNTYFDRFYNKFMWKLVAGWHRTSEK